MSEVCLASLVKQYNLGEDVKSQVTEIHLEMISRSYCSKWKRLPSHLKMESVIVDDIDRLAVDEDEKRLKFLSTWRAAKGSGATYEKLITALLKIDCVNHAEGVCKILQKDVAPKPKENSASRDPSQDIDMSSIDPNVRMDLKHQLKLNHRTIQFKYATFVSRLCECVKEKGIDIKDLRTFLLRLPALESDDLDPGLLSDVKNKLKEADSINRIFDLIGDDCASFIHYDIFQFIMEEYCTDLDSKDPKLNYSEHFRDYISMHRISEFFDINSRLKEKFSDDFKELAFKVDNIKMSSKVITIENLRHAIAENLGIKPSTLKLVNVEEGCVVITFLIPHVIAEIVFAPGKKMHKRQAAKFRSLSIKWLKCGAHEADFTKQQTLPTHDTQNLQELINLVREGKVDKVAAFLDQNEIDLNQVKRSSSGGDSVTPLSLAAMHGHLEMAELLLRWGANVNFKDGGTHSALRKAVEGKSTNMVKFLVKNGAETMDQNSWDCPLTYACEQGDLEMVKALLPHGANRANHFEFQRSISKRPKIPGDGAEYSHPMSPVNTAIEYGHVEVVEWLLNHGAKMPSGALCLAIDDFWKKIPDINYLVKMLLAKGAQVNPAEQGKMSPLMFASCNGKSDVVEMLLKGGATVDYKDHEWGNFSLLLAVKYGHTEVVKLLLEAGAQVNVKGRYGYPLETAMNYLSQDKADSIVKLLLDGGANPNLHEEHTSVLMSAIENKLPYKVVELLLDKGADIDYQSSHKDYALKRAVSGGHLEIVQLLFTRGARTDLLDEKGKSILMASRDVPTAKFLLNNKVPINHQDNDGGYALLDALHDDRISKNYKLVELLLERGADPTLLKEDDTSASSHIRKYYAVILRHMMTRRENPEDFPKIKLLMPEDREEVFMTDDDKFRQGLMDGLSEDQRLQGIDLHEFSGLRKLQHHKYQPVQAFAQTGASYHVHRPQFVPFSALFLNQPYLGGQSAGVSSGHDDGSSVVPMEESVKKPKKRPRSSSDDDKRSGKKSLQRSQLTSLSGESTSISSLPAGVRRYLDEVLDWDQKGVDKDLMKIAHHMLGWEEQLSALLGLTQVDIHDIKEIYFKQPELQRIEALRRWKNKRGLRATYRNLLQVFEEAAHSCCAQALCDTLTERQ